MLWNAFLIAGPAAGGVGGLLAALPPGAQELGLLGGSSPTARGRLRLGKYVI